MQRVRKMVAGEVPERMDGGGVTVAVLDTGIGPHPDLQGRTAHFRDFVGHRKDRYDDSGHGTHVCGILCGSGALSGGRLRGIAPGVRLVVGKILDERGDGTTEAMLEGLDWVLGLRREYDIRIVNISVGIGSLREWEKEWLLQKKIEELWYRGILVVCAAGNKGPKEGSISAVGGKCVVTVGCYDGSFSMGNPRSCERYSGRGISGSPVRKPDLVAPGTDIYSCNLRFQRGLGRPYVAKSGTSMATPMVSGAAALAFQKYPGMTNEECKQRLQFSATDLGLAWNRQGWGLLNIGRLLDVRSGFKSPMYPG
ncbi:MAG: S8 family peptidase [Lachnospiraceae bacterium]|nr:S8 family peptidase [Lachnospiraceae bacterium]